VRVKEYGFPVSAEWLGDTRVASRVEGKAEIETSSPPVFRGSDPGIWSPEDFFVAASVSCLAITTSGIAERRGLPLHSLRASGEGVVGSREDGRFGFSRLTMRVEIETDEGMEELAREVARKAEEGCLVTVSLDLPIETEVEVRTVPVPA
jgi:organic hydroperoxide reductase OsmC/OhrA